MTEEKKVQYFNIFLCRAGMLLIGLGLIRVLSIHQDQLGFLLGFGGFLMISIHIQALEKRWDILKKAYLDQHRHLCIALYSAFLLACFSTHIIKETGGLR